MVKPWVCGENVSATGRKQVDQALYLVDDLLLLAVVQLVNREEARDAGCIAQFLFDKNRVGVFEAVYDLAFRDVAEILDPGVVRPLCVNVRDHPDIDNMVNYLLEVRPVDIPVLLVGEEAVHALVQRNEYPFPGIDF